MSEVTGKRSETVTIHYVGDNWVGTLVDANGKPIADATLKFKSDDGSTGKGTTNDDGKFDVESSNWVDDLTEGKMCSVTVNYGDNCLIEGEFIQKLQPAIAETE